MVSRTTKLLPITSLLLTDNSKDYSIFEIQWFLKAT